MKRVIGSPQLFLASSAPEKMPVSDSDRRLRSIIASLEEFQVYLAGSANQDAAQLLAIAVLQLRMRVHQIADSELKALCDAITFETNPNLPEASSGRVS